MFLYKQDRLVRDADMLGYLRYTFRQRNIKLHCIDVGAGVNSIGAEPTQETVIAGIMGQVAALERKNILDRTKAGREKALEESRQSGMRVFGRKPKFTAEELAWCIRQLALGNSYRDTIAKFNKLMLQAALQYKIENNGKEIIPKTMSKATLCREVERLRREKGLDIYDPDFLKEYKTSDSYCPTRNMVRDDVRLGRYGERNYLDSEINQLEKEVINATMTKEEWELFNRFQMFNQSQHIYEMVKQNCNTIVEIIYVFWGIPPQTL